MNVTVTIGRDRDGSAMRGSEWRRFRHLVRHTLETRGTVVYDGEGDGIWEGNIEQAHCFVVVFDDGYWFPNIKLRLRQLAGHFGQDAIAWTEGEAEFLSP